MDRGYKNLLLSTNNPVLMDRVLKNLLLSTEALVSMDGCWEGQF